MEKRVLIILAILVIALSFLFLAQMTGFVTQEPDQFADINTSHWTHMPLTYSIDKNCGNLKESIIKSFSVIENSTNKSVYFKEGNNPDIKKSLSSPSSKEDGSCGTSGCSEMQTSVGISDINISCSQIENCYEKKTERRWFWIITTEAICEHESGTAQITKMRGNKIISAKINLFSISKENNCSETEIHELLHVFGYEHSENNESIMYPETSSVCKEYIDKDIAADLMKKYSH